MPVRLCQFLIRLYPSRFRSVFNEEIFAVFCERLAEERNRGFVSRMAFCSRELAALIVGASREWLRWMRDPAAESFEATPAAGHVHDGVPGFYTSEDYSPRRSALIQGLILSLAVFSGLSFVMGHWGRQPILFVGSHGRDGAGLLGVQTPAVSPMDLTTEVRLRLRWVKPKDLWSAIRSLLAPGASIAQSQSSGETGSAPKMPKTVVAFDPPKAGNVEDEDQWDVRGFASGYFRNIRLLGALDADRDGILSAAEIAGAPVALQSLDANHDGSLSPEECGVGSASVMHFHPVLAALDADHNGEISAAEIRNASSALKALDRNGDGRLTWDETVPDAITVAVAVVMRLDANGDGKISKEERSNPHAAAFGALLDAADRNQDGVVTEEELTKEIRLRSVLGGLQQPARHR